MSPAMQKLRKSLDGAKARHPAQSPGEPATAHHPSVGFDVIELLFAAIAAQDAEIRKIKGEKMTTDSSAVEQAPVSAVEPAVDHTDTYVGHTETPATQLVYTMKQSKPTQPPRPATDETA